MTTSEPEFIIIKQKIKETVLILAKEHKISCHKQNCGVSLFYLRLLLDNAEIELTVPEREVFL